jgi:predicted methyltransferase
MRPYARLLLPAALLVALAACSEDEPEAPAPQAQREEAKPADAPRVVAADTHAMPKEEPRGVQVATGPVMDANMKRILEKMLPRGHRDPKNTARDIYRHPLQTLEFFGLQQGMTVVEVTPAPGYWTELLAPTLKNTGKYIAATWDDSVPGQPEYHAALNAELKNKMWAKQHYGRAELLKFDPAHPSFGPPGTADMVLTFRNAHNWIAEGTAPAYFKAMADVLKPGGVLGLEDHRAPEGEPTDGKRGYVTEDQVIQLAAAAGFVLSDRSEINANPKDTKDYPEGVWVLPPTYELGDKDRDRYTLIGESDRMTLKFIKQ